MRTLAWIDRRSLELHAAVADKLEAQPELLDLARAKLARWLPSNPATALRRWQDLRERTPLAQRVVLLRSLAEPACRLRQSSPFAGILSPEERRAILDRHEPPGAREERRCGLSDDGTVAGEPRAQ